MTASIPVMPLWFSNAFLADQRITFHSSRGMDINNLPPMICTEHQTIPNLAKPFS
jgi:hypothetical protein